MSWPVRGTTAGGERPPGGLPDELAGVSALAVVAHPDDESFGLGAVLATMAAARSRLRVLCLTKGEASTLGEPGGLAAARQAELAEAAARLGLSGVFLADFADGALSLVPERILDDAVERELGDATVIVTFESGGVTGHPDHQAAFSAAARAAGRHGLLLAEWGVSPEVADGLRRELGVPFTALDGPDVTELAVDRLRQRAAIACHVSQATGNTVLERRLALQRNRERVRLTRPAPLSG